LINDNFRQSKQNYSNNEFVGISSAHKLKTASGLGGSMSPIRKSFADPKMNVFKAADPSAKTILELSKIKD
jgi:hypothetical protein